MQDMKTDMRWVRTERHIMQAFEDALREKPLGKVSVTSLAQAAEINKATFYLHYHDIYDLAAAYARLLADRIVDGIDCFDAFFDEPRSFVKSFVGAFSLEDHFENGKLLFENKLMHHFMDRFIENMRARLKEVCPIADGVKPEIAITFVLHGFLGTLPHFVERSHDELIDVLTHMLEVLGRDGLKAMS